MNPPAFLSRQFRPHFVLSLVVAASLAGSGLTATVDGWDLTESAALLSFRAGLRMEGLLRENPWKGDPCPNTNVTISPWAGITCSMGHVTAVVLESKGLLGPLAASLANLTRLEILNLSNNSLTGTIPDAYSNLKALKVLLLASNYITGRMPEALGNLKKLEQYSVSSNLINGTIPASVGNMTGLKLLSVSFNKLTGTVPSELANLVRLEKLRLHYNNLSGPLPTNLSQLSNLTELRVAKNRLSGAFLDFSYHDRINTIEADYNLFKGPLPRLKECKNLTWVSMSNNNLTGTLPSEYSTLKSLKTLYIQKNYHLKGGIPEGWSALQNLQTLSLSNNDLKWALPETWGALQNLQVLNLNNNQLSGTLPGNWSSMQSLQILQLANNSLTGKLPPEWAPSKYYGRQSMRDLQFADLSVNQLEGTVPGDWLSQFQRLEFLDLSFNKLTGRLPYLSYGSPFYIPQGEGSHSLGTVALIPMRLGYGLCDVLPPDVNVSMWTANESDGVFQGWTSIRATPSTASVRDCGDWIPRRQYRTFFPIWAIVVVTMLGVCISGAIMGGIRAACQKRKPATGTVPSKKLFWVGSHRSATTQAPVHLQEATMPRSPM